MIFWHFLLQIILPFKFNCGGKTNQASNQNSPITFFFTKKSLDYIGIAYSRRNPVFTDSLQVRCVVAKSRFANL